MSKGRVAPSVPAEPYMLKEIRDPAFAAAYLSYCAGTDDPSDFIFALREVAEAYGGMGRIAQRAKLSRSQLYKTLSRSGNPEFRTLRAILAAAGFLLTVVPKEKLKVRKSSPRSAAKSAVARRRSPEPGVVRQA